MQHRDATKMNNIQHKIFYAKPLFIKKTSIILILQPFIFFVKSVFQFNLFNNTKKYTLLFLITGSIINHRLIKSFILTNYIKVKNLKC